MYSQAITRIIQIQKIGKQNQLMKYFNLNSSHMTTLEKAALLSRAVYLDVGNKDGVLDKPLSNYPDFVHSLVIQLSDSIQNLPVDQFKYMVRTLSKLNGQRWVIGMEKLILNFLDMVSKAIMNLFFIFGVSNFLNVVGRRGRYYAVLGNSG